MQAIILKKNVFDESSEIVTMFARNEGKVRAVARAVKSAKSRLSHGLESLFYSEVEALPGRKLPTITGVKAINTFKDLREDLDKVYLALFAAELVLKSTADEQPNQELFESFLALLEHLDAAAHEKTGKCHGVCADVFALRLLAQTGYALTFEKCASCGKDLAVISNAQDIDGKRADRPEPVAFSNRKGGFICAACTARISDAKPVSSEMYAFIRNSQDKTYAQLDAEFFQTKPLHTFVDAFATFILERNLNASKYLATLK